jgi:hypothetical protein
MIEKRAPLSRHIGRHVEQLLQRLLHNNPFRDFRLHLVDEVAEQAGDFLLGSNHGVLGELVGCSVGPPRLPGMPCPALYEIVELLENKSKTRAGLGKAEVKLSVRL